MDQNSSATPEAGARARNGAAKARNAEARTAKARGALAKMASAQGRGQRPRDCSRAQSARTAQRAACHAGRRFFGAAAGPSNRRRRQNLRCLQHHRRREPTHRAAARARGRGGGTSRQDAHPGPLRIVGRRMGRHGRLGQCVDRRFAVADHRRDAHRHRGRTRRSVADRAAGCGRPALEGRVPALREHRQHDDQAAQHFHLGSHARGARSRHRRQARRPGPGARSDRRLEGLDRKRELHGVESDGAGPQSSRKSRSPSPTAICRKKLPSTCAARFCSSRKPSIPWWISCALSPPR